MLTTPSQPPPPSKRVLKNPLLYSSIVIGIALIAVGWTLFSRWQENRQIEARNRDEAAHKQRESDRAALEQLGGKELAIQSFYGSPAVIRRGDSAQLCYGVANAKTVKLEPQPNPVWPSYARCIDVSPKKDTTYTLTITDAAGNSKSATVSIKVH